MLLESAYGRAGEGIIPVADRMAAVGGGDRLEHLRMHAGIVVAGEAAGGFHGLNNVADDPGGAIYFESSGSPRLSKLR